MDANSKIHNVIHIGTTSNRPSIPDEVIQAIKDFISDEYDSFKPTLISKVTELIDNEFDNHKKQVTNDVIKLVSPLFTGPINPKAPKIAEKPSSV